MVSVREFARRDGCSERRVRNAIQTGHLSRSPAGFLPAELAGTGWRERNRRGADTADNSSPVRTRRATVSAPLPDAVCTLAAVIKFATQDVAVLLMRLGHKRAVVKREANAWFELQRRAASDCATEDLGPPPGGGQWADHHVFLSPWLEGSCWAELQEMAAGRDAS